MKNKSILKIIVLSVYFVGMAIGTVTPALASIAAAFPSIPFTTLLLVSTLPTLISVPATLISGRLAGGAVKYKTLLVGGMILFLIGGIAPYFISSFGGILALRAVFGVGLGIVAPLGGALIIAFFDGDDRAKMMGLSGVIGNIGGIIFQLLGGIAASIMWNISFLVHGIGIVTLLLVLFLPEPEKAPAPQAGEAAPKMPSIVYMYSGGLLVTMMLVYPLLVNMSSIILAGGMGDASVAALVLTMFTVSGMLAGVVFAKLFGIFKQNTISVGVALLAVAMVCMAFGNTIVFMYLAATACGFGFSMMMPTIFMGLGMKVHPTQMATASGMVMASMNVGGFVSAYFFAFVGGMLGQTDNLKFPFYLAMIAFAVATLGLLIIKPKEEAKA